MAGGFAEVSGDRVKVLADHAEPVGSIDAAAAQTRLAEARERLSGLSVADARYEVEMATVRRETARIALAGRRG